MMKKDKIKEMFPDLETYISRHYEEESPAGGKARSRKPSRSVRRSAVSPRRLPCDAAGAMPPMAEASECIEFNAIRKEEPKCISENSLGIISLDESFSLRLQKLIDLKGMDDIDCYKKANVSRQTWHKIIDDPDYRPAKKTIICFALVLGLTPDEAQSLLATAGFTLSKSSLSDVIIMYALEKGIRRITDVDEILYEYDQATLS